MIFKTFFVKEEKKSTRLQNVARQTRFKLLCCQIKYVGGRAEKLPGQHNSALILNFHSKDLNKLGKWSVKFIEFPD